ncbi:MAG TPA: permease, partial [Bacteroidales bacterium]
MSTIQKIDKTRIIVPVLLLFAWFIFYHYLQPVTDWLIDRALGLEKGTHLTESIRFFIFELPKVL